MVGEPVGRECSHYRAPLKQHRFRNDPMRDRNLRPFRDCDRLVMARVRFGVPIHAEVAPRYTRIVANDDRIARE
jgi:hypothetical protein